MKKKHAFLACMLVLAAIALVAHSQGRQRDNFGVPQNARESALDRVQAALKPVPFSATNVSGRTAVLKGALTKRVMQSWGWNVSYMAPEKNVQIVDNMLRYILRKGKTGRENGASIHINPNNAFPKESGSLKFSVKFPQGFPFKNGGKLLGFSIANRKGNHASGGDWKSDGASVRFMWRDHPSDDRTHYLTAYLYSAVKKQAGTSWSQAAYNKQGPDTRAVMDVGPQSGSSPPPGNSLWWKKAPSGFILTRGVWYTLTLTVVLNTPGVPDGSLRIVCENRSTGAVQEKTATSVYYRDSGDVKIQELLLDAFFGGQDVKEYAPPYDTRIDIKDLWAS